MDTFGLGMTLLLGASPADGRWSMAQLKRAWTVYRREWMASRRLPGARCWAWWVFERGEPMPSSHPGQVARLLELNELGDKEVAAVIEQAQEAIEYADWADELDRIGAVRTGPAEAAAHMRAERHADAEEWRRLLTELDAPAQPPRRRVRRP
jgi:hypothetical protein